MKNVDNFQHIFIIEDKKGMRIVTLEQGSYSIGRDAKSGIILYDTQVSRNHATLVRTTDYKNNTYNYKIIDGDLNGKRSTNGIIVNGRGCLSHELNHGDYIVFGGKAKASYQIIANQTEIDILKDNVNNNSTGNLGPSTGTLTDESKQTLVTPTEQLQQLNVEELKKLASFPEFSPHPIIEINWQGEITYLNRAARLKFKDIQQNRLQHPILADLLTKTKTGSKQGSLFLREVRIGSEVFEQYVHYLPESQYIRSYIFDFTKRKQVELALRESEERYRAVVRQSREGIFLVELSTMQIVEVNQAYCDLLGYTKGEILGMNLFDLIPTNCEVVEQNLDKLAQTKEDLVGESLHRRKNGSLLNVISNITKLSSGGKDIYSFVVREVNSQNYYEENLTNKPFHDALTGLPKQILFCEHLETAIANGQRYENMIAVMIFDLEQFKNINNYLGHNHGDKILKDISQKLKAGLRGGDIIARWDGDKFAVLLSRIVNHKDVPRISQRLLEIIQQPIEIEGEIIQVKSKVGISIYPKDGDNAKILIDGAISILERIKKITVLSEEQSKQNGKGNYGVRSKDFLSEALGKNQFLLYYQPIINFKNSQLTGIEALLRWLHPKHGLLCPENFLEETIEKNLICEIGEWVLETACTQIKNWQEAGLLTVPITVNISAKEILAPDFVSKVEKTLLKTGVEAKYLILEIGEKIVLQNQKLLKQPLEDLTRLGVSLSLDDCCFGGANASTFDQFKFSSLKIHQYLVGNLKNAPQDLGMISGMLTLGKNFNIKVIAEGVENKEQLDLLSSVSCEEMQGFLLSKPLNLDKTTIFLERGKFGIII